MSRERQPEQQEVKGWQVLLSQLLGGWKTPDGSQQAQQILDEMDYPSFASLLPYRRYDPDSELFINARTAGFILESVRRYPVPMRPSVNHWIIFYGIKSPVKFR